MAKITRHGGPSDASLPQNEPGDVNVDESGPGDDEPVEDESDADVEPVVPEPVGDAESPGDEAPSGEEVDGSVPPRPAVNDSKADWVDYAVASGCDRDEAEALTKRALIDAYGE